MVHKIYAEFKEKDTQLRMQQKKHIIPNIVSTGNLLLSGWYKNITRFALYIST
jgi:hypothetical protein